ncbi:hypothetical protein [Marivita sp. XM-24bin2]|uniref:hypothetical protein n=1 Tax=unclassified Marivita TaxID=2632480 RepID=UPI0025BF0087|nr:hypothetical protein [Marivita sp. XM-24bin2]MCR9109936.1 hypothetical protein [Paracoccaceae bacterium]
MQRRQIITGLLASVVLPATAFAQTAEDQVIDQLKRQGYRRITLGSTFLGRTRIVATGPRGRREIILNPSTGAILRDYLDRSDDDDDRDDRSSGRNDSSDEDRDEDDQDDDRDNSGSGNGGRDDNRDENDDDNDERDDDDNNGDDDGGGGGGGDDSDDDDDQ